MKLCDDFNNGSINFERINWVHIALIAKKNVAEEVSDFRPISLINSTSKTISKILASRLSQVIHLLVDDSQSGFIKERCIADNIVAAQEVILKLQKQKTLGYAFKVDFAKAFDSVDWNFLLEILAARGFGSK